MQGKNKFTKFLAILLVLAAMTALASTALAAQAGKNITVYPGVNIIVDGVELDPTDVNGKPVETFIYDGTTYVPLRAVSEALGKPVDWDGATRTVYIGKIPGQDMYLNDVCPPYQTDGVDTFDYVTMAGNRYLDNLCFPRSIYNECGWALYNLNGQFTSLEFDVGHRDGRSMFYDGTLKIYLDGDLAYTMDLDCEMLPTHVVVPLDGALQMKITGTGDDYCFAIVNAIIK